ncbi:MAG TPA: hypothetical protein VFX25_01835 [Streptosporangiaceae bacterium]|nr:hypothetical protein [Streptosporangiaceae bacterium]
MRGRVVEVSIAVKSGREPSPQIEARAVTAIETEIGKIARPNNVWIVPDMPRTRSGTTMRRVIAAESSFADVGDVTTLANPEIVEDIGQHGQGAKVAPTRCYDSSPRPSSRKLSSSAPSDARAGHDQSSRPGERGGAGRGRLGGR